MSAPSSVPNIGTVNCKVVAPANGNSNTAPKVVTMPIRPTAVRRTCAPNRWVRSDERPGPVTTIPKISIAAKA